jgi:surface carbohydrate biosynthesis protein (TIGR04326 family)
MAWTGTRSPALAFAESPNRSRSLTVWDSGADAVVEHGVVYHWNGYSEIGTSRSLFRYVEKHGERLRSKYLAWIHDLGQSECGGKRLVEHLTLEEGFSYWWMTLLTEQSPWKSPSIMSAIRLFALEEIILEARPNLVRIVTADLGLATIVEELCANLHIPYAHVQPVADSRIRWTLRDVYRRLPFTVQGLISFVRLMHLRWPLRYAGAQRWFGGKRSVLLCSYFLHFDQPLAALGEFKSQFWGQLPAILQETGYGINWLHQYVHSSSVPNPRAAREMVRRFSERNAARGHHSFLDAYWSWRLLLRVFRRWAALHRVNLRLARGMEQAFRPTGSHFSLWPLMRADWYASLIGPPALTNCLSIDLFDEALQDLPHQRVGLYVCENQSWERALVRAWRKHGHGQLIAVQHSTVRFWDLRYFIDPRTLDLKGECALPRADLLALNGRAAVDAEVAAGYPQDAIVECEALRFGYLEDIGSYAPPERSGDRQLRVLILGDYSPVITDKMLRLLELAAARLRIDACYTVKPHPGCSVNPQRYPLLRLQATAEPLGSILRAFDVAYASSVTSAAVDAYLAGLPVAVLLTQEDLVFSPLRGQPGAHFVAEPEELAAVLQEARDSPVKRREWNDFFFLDAALPRWRRLLNVERDTA